jgi:hypothetical protein
MGKFRNGELTVEAGGQTDGVSSDSIPINPRSTLHYNGWPPRSATREIVL